MDFYDGDYYTEKWWEENGALQLNALLINLIGKGIGFAPLSNFIDIPDFVVKQDLEDLIYRDGLKTQMVDDEILIFIK